MELGKCMKNVQPYLDLVMGETERCGDLSLAYGLFDLVGEIEEALNVGDDALCAGDAGCRGTPPSSPSMDWSASLMTASAMLRRAECRASVSSRSYREK